MAIAKHVHNILNDYFFQMRFIDIMNREGVNIMIAYPEERKKCKRITSGPNQEAAENE